MIQAPLIDTHGRVVRDLRISVTDRCNLRCVYCMPAEGMPWLPKDDLLTYEEITRFAGIALGMGVNGIRLTGGEPTVRADLPKLVAMLNALQPDLDLSITTNGLKLTAMADELRAAGLKRVNVSLDTLQRERFHQIARRDRFDDVIAGLEAARRVGFTPIKVNAVLMRGFNQDEAVALARWGREQQCEVRFIEWMPLDFQHTWEREKLVPADGSCRRSMPSSRSSPRPDGIERPRHALPVSRRRRHGRRHRVGDAPVLRALRPHSPDRRRPDPYVPVLTARVRFPQGHARRRGRYGGRASAVRGGSTQGARAFDQQPVLQAAGARYERDRRLSALAARFARVGSFGMTTP
jgi:molybdenum cofactor biosynthesis protein A